MSEKTFKILIVDQFASVPSPYQLQQRPMPFDDLCKLALAARQPSYGHKAEVKEVDDSFSPPMCTTTFRADPEGIAEVWKYRWDSSG
jgi:hypothetical protein